MRYFGDIYRWLFLVNRWHAFALGFRLSCFALHCCCSYLVVWDIVVCYFNDRLIESILVCIQYCTIIECFGLWTLQSLMISLRLACFVWLWLSLYCNFGYLFAVCGIVTALAFDGTRDIRRDRTRTFFWYDGSVTVNRIVLRVLGSWQ